MNIEENIELLMQQTKDLADRCMACPADSEDYMRYQRQIEANEKLIIDYRKKEMEHENELRRIELEKIKTKNELNWKSPKFWIPLALTTVTTMVSIFVPPIFQRNTLREHRRESMQWEHDGNMFTSQAGRANANVYSSFLSGSKGRI